MANYFNDYFSKIATDDTYDLDSIQEAVANIILMLVQITPFVHWTISRFVKC